MAELPDYYMDLGVDPKASPQEIEKVYGKRVAQLRASTVEDAPEELAEVEAAYDVLRDPARRASYDVQLLSKEREEDEEFEKKNPEVKAFMENQQRRHRNRRTGSWLDAIFDLLKFFK